MQWPDHADLARVVEAFDADARLQSHWPLPGGVSAQVAGLELSLSAGRSRVVVFRRYARNPARIVGEFRLLRHLHNCDNAALPVPEALLLDTAGELLGAPYMLLEFLPGQTTFEPANVDGLIKQAVTALDAIHAIDVRAPALEPLPQREFARHTFEDAAVSTLRANILTELQPHWPPPVTNEPVLNHGDFWPGNLLWLDGTLTGVIDWEDANLADPLADLANTRLEFLWAYGADAMTVFTEHYLRDSNVVATHLPSWDLDAALRAEGAISSWGLAAAKAAKMSGELEWFVACAAERLNG